MTRVRLEDLIGGGEDRADWARQAEADRLDHVRGFGAVPEACGPEIGAAVARGTVRAVRMGALYPARDGGFEVKPAGFQGRSTVVVADVFDRMAVASARKGGRFGLTKGQVEMGRLYARTVERHLAGAVRCSSVEARAGSGSGGGADGFTEARLASARRIDLWHGRIGAGQAMAVKRLRKRRPSGQVQRVTITARQLVDAVCLEDLEISKVLRRYGWAVYGSTVRDCTEALGAILDRMSGPVKRGEILSLRTDLPQDFWGT